MIQKVAMFPWNTSPGQIITNSDFKRAVRVYEKVKDWCDTNSRSNYIIDETVYATGIKVDFDNEDDANEFDMWQVRHRKQWLKQEEYE